MFDVTTILGSIGGVCGIATAIGSVVYQRRQTQLMEIGLERAIAAPEDETGTGIESKLRTLINKRLYDFRSRIRQEFAPRIEKIEEVIQTDQIREYTRILRFLESRDDVNETAEEAKRIEQKSCQLRSSFLLSQINIATTWLSSMLATWLRKSERLRRCDNNSKTCETVSAIKRWCERRYA